MTFSADIFNMIHYHKYQKNR